jgi:hypothetical protein
MWDKVLVLIHLELCNIYSMVDIRVAWTTRINPSLHAMAVWSMKNSPWATQFNAPWIGFGFHPKPFPLSLILRPNE